MRGIARNIARDIQLIKFSIPETMSGKIKKWFHVAQYRREKQAGSFRRDWLLLGILGLGNGDDPFGGLARATGGYRYLLATPPVILSDRVIDTGIKPTCRGEGLSVI